MVEGEQNKCDVKEEKVEKLQVILHQLKQRKIVGQEGREGTGDSTVHHDKTLRLYKDSGVVPRNNIDNQCSTRNHSYYIFHEVCFVFFRSLSFYRVECFQRTMGGILNLHLELIYATMHIANASTLLINSLFLALWLGKRL